MIQTIKQSNTFKHKDGRTILLKLIQENSYTFNLLSEQTYINGLGNSVKRVNQTLAGSSLTVAEEKYKKTLDRYTTLGYKEKKEKRV